MYAAVSVGPVAPLSTLRSPVPSPPRPTRATAPNSLSVSHRFDARHTFWRRCIRIGLDPQVPGTAGRVLPCGPGQLAASVHRVPGQPGHPGRAAPGGQHVRQGRRRELRVCGGARRAVPRRLCLAWRTVSRYRFGLRSGGVGGGACTPMLCFVARDTRRQHPRHGAGVAIHRFRIHRFRKMPMRAVQSPPLFILLCCMRHGISQVVTPRTTWSPCGPARPPKCACSSLALCPRGRPGRRRDRQVFRRQASRRCGAVQCCVVSGPRALACGRPLSATPGNIDFGVCTHIHSALNNQARPTTAMPAYLVLCPQRPIPTPPSLFDRNGDQHTTQGGGGNYYAL